MRLAELATHCPSRPTWATLGAEPRLCRMRPRLRRQAWPAHRCSQTRLRMGPPRSTPKACPQRWPPRRWSLESHHGRPQPWFARTCGSRGTRDRRSHALKAQRARHRDTRATSTGRGARAHEPKSRSRRSRGFRSAHQHRMESRRRASLLRHHYLDPLRGARTDRQARLPKHEPPSPRPPNHLLGPPWS